MPKMDHHCRIRGFQLTNFMSFAESVFLAGFNQKTAKEDLIVKGKHRIPLRYLRGKTLEGSRSHVTEAEDQRMTCGATRPHCQVARPPMGPPDSLVTMSVSYCLLGYIYAIL